MFIICFVRPVARSVRCPLSARVHDSTRWVTASRALECPAMLASQVPGRHVRDSWLAWLVELLVVMIDSKWRSLDMLAFHAALPGHVRNPRPQVGVAVSSI
ncbi:hypothetical protein R1flu_003343 [Riccia fluitans]|uniref:Secreted protein n=1 Tax=Riccia fluitans TaxID=41844 RepID=A0ABD1Y8R4_9MARC